MWMTLDSRVSIHYPETEHRKKDIDLIEPSHPLLPVALHCLKDRDTERPPADELCGRLASLKMEPRYTHSVEQTGRHVQRLQEDQERERTKHHEEKDQLQKEERVELQEQAQREHLLV